MRQWLLDPAEIYQATRFSDAAAQRRLLARAAEIGKIWPELPGARQRALVTALIGRIDVGAEQIDIRTHPSRLGVFVDGDAAPSPSATDDETQTLSVPMRVSPLRAGDQDADRQHRSVCHRQTQRAADQA